LGISEQSDALAVVVSEERGKVSVVERGTISVVDETAELLGWLSDRLARPEEKPSRRRALKALLTQNWRPKLATLVAVSLLWFVLVGQQNAELGFAIPVVYLNVPEELSIQGDQVQDVLVRVRGSRGVLNFLDPSQLKVAIDLRKARAGTRRYTISAKEIELPPGVQLVGVNPSVIPVRLSDRPPKDVGP
jgi:hypothetical protein